MACEPSYVQSSHLTLVHSAPPVSGANVHADSDSICPCPDIEPFQCPAHAHMCLGVDLTGSSHNLRILVLWDQQDPTCNKNKRMNENNENNHFKVASDTNIHEWRKHQWLQMHHVMPKYWATGVTAVVAQFFTRVAPRMFLTMGIDWQLSPSHVPIVGKRSNNRYT